MEEKVHPKPQKAFTKRDLALIHSRLHKFEGLPTNGGQTPVIGKNIILLAVDLGNNPHQDSYAETAKAKALLSRLLADIESGSDLHDRIIKLAVSEHDWRKLVAGKNKQPDLPLEVGMSVSRK